MIFISCTENFLDKEWRLHLFMYSVMTNLYNVVRDHVDLEKCPLYVFHWDSWFYYTWVLWQISSCRKGYPCYMGIKSNSRAAWYACHYCNLKITVLYLFLFWLTGGLLALRTLHLLVFIVKGFYLWVCFKSCFHLVWGTINSLFSGWALLWLLRILL